MSCLQVSQLSNTSTSTNSSSRSSKLVKIMLIVVCDFASFQPTVCPIVVLHKHELMKIMKVGCISLFAGHIKRNKMFFHMIKTVTVHLLQQDF